MVAEDALQLRDVGKPRHVVEDKRFLREQRRDHQRQRGVLRARNGNSAVERAAANNTNAVHATPLALHNLSACASTAEAATLRRFDGVGAKPAARHSGALTK